MRLLEKINDFEIEQAKLKLEINNAIYDKLSDSSDVPDVSRLHLTHKINGYNISYLTREFGIVLCKISKKYDSSSLLDLPMSDLKILVKHFNI